MGSVAPAFLKEDQKEEIDYSIPCLISSGLILVKKDTKIKAYLDLAGMRVATIRGTRGERKNLRVGVDLKPVHPSPIQRGVRKGDKEWRDFVNIQLSEMIATGEYHKILEKWFGKVRAEFLELALRKEIKLNN